MLKQILFTITGLSSLCGLWAQDIDMDLQQKVEQFLQDQELICYAYNEQEDDPKEMLFLDNISKTELEEEQVDQSLSGCLARIENANHYLDQLHDDVSHSLFTVGVNTGSPIDFDEIQSTRPKPYEDEHPDMAMDTKVLGIMQWLDLEPLRQTDYYKSQMEASNKKRHRANLYHDLGGVYYLRQEYTKAEKYYNKAFKIQQKIFGEKHEAVAITWGNLGLVHWKQYQYKKAARYCHTALKMLQELLGDKHPDVATIYSNLGLIYKDKNYYDKALEYFDEALKIRLDTQERNHIAIANSYNNKANIYFIQRNYNQAQKLYTKALDIRSALLGKHHIVVAGSYINMGNTYSISGYYDEALKYYFKAFNIQKQVFRKKATKQKSIGIAGCANNIGLIYYNKGLYDRALKYCSLALEVRLNIFGEKDAAVATSYNNIAFTHAKKGEYEKSLQYYKRAIIANVPQFNSKSVYKNPKLMYKAYDEIELLKSLFAKAFALFNLEVQSNETRKDHEEYINTLNYAYDRFDKLRKGYLTEAPIFDLGEKFQEIQGSAIRACQEAFLKTDNEEYLNLALKFAEKGKTIVLSAVIQESQARKYSGIPDYLLEKEQVLKKGRFFYEQKIREKQDSFNLVNCKSQLRKINLEWETFMGRLETEYPRYYELKYKSDVATVDNIRSRLLDDESAFVEYTVGENTIWVVAITKNAIHLKEIDWSEKSKKDVDNLIQQIHTVPDNSNGASRVKALTDYSSVAYRVYQLLIESILSEVDPQIKKLQIVPDGILHNLPFEALLTETYGAEDVAWRQVNNRLAKLPYLGKHYVVNYNTSGTLALLLKTMGAKSKAKNKVLLYGPFAEKPKLKKGKLTADLEKRKEKRSHLNHGSLSATWNEMRSIAEKYDGFFYLSQQATEHSFKMKSSSKNYSIIHITSHGEAASEDEYKSARIYFNGNKDEAEDNELNDHEIYNLDMNAELVVLSACETGQGKYQKGEGIMSLARAFNYAGCPALVVTLWEVEDSCSAKLMKHFYTTLATGKTKEVALQEARIGYLDEVQGKTSGLKAHPHYWAGYIGLGNNSSLPSGR